MGPVRKLMFVMLAGGIAACGTIDPDANWNPTEATIFRIDRLCASRYTSTEVDKPTEVVTNTHDCRMSTTFLKTASGQAGRANFVNATATVKVTYIAPQDNAEHIGHLKFTSADDEFYLLKAGDKIGIFVAADDPETIRFNRSA